MFTGHRVVNLTPLFQWWLQQSTPTNAAHYQVANLNLSTNVADVTPADTRPLAAWHLVTGTHAATAGESWVVTGLVYTSPTARTNTRVILRNPPAAEEQAYYLLRTQLAEAGLEITNAQRTYESNLKSSSEAENRALAYGRSRTIGGAAGYTTYHARARQYQQAADTAAAQKQQLETLKQQFLEQLKTIPAANGDYQVNWFAMQIGRTKAGLPVYDMGVPSSTPP
jgi:hypothetical protein